MWTSMRRSRIFGRLNIRDFVFPSFVVMSARLKALACVTLNRLEFQSVKAKYAPEPDYSLQLLFSQIG